MVMVHVPKQVLQRTITKSGELYVVQVLTDIDLMDGRVDQQR